MGLLELIEHEKEMRKIFGKQELTIMKKQLLGINLSASEKTRLSRDIRTKLNIIKKISDFKEEFNLKKAQEIKYLINETKETILKSKEKNKIKEIIIFGSTVENSLRLNSDIDIAVKFDKINLKEATNFRLEITSKASKKIDIQVYNILPNKLKKEIDKKGKIIYKNEHYSR